MILLENLNMSLFLLEREGILYWSKNLRWRYVRLIGLSTIITVQHLHETFILIRNKSTLQQCFGLIWPSSGVCYTQTTFRKLSELQVEYNFVEVILVMLINIFKVDPFFAIEWNIKWIITIKIALYKSIVGCRPITR